MIYDKSEYKGYIGRFGGFKGIIELYDSITLCIFKYKKSYESVKRRGNQEKLGNNMD